MGSMLLQNQLGSLETGLKDLKRSRLMGIQEFKDMYFAIEKHHRNLKLAHLTGQARDLQIQAEQDTKFYNILIKMMNEVKQLRTAQQRDSLMKVFTWFKANRHTLHAGPHFGKAHQLKEASEVLRKAQGSSPSPRKHKVVTSDQVRQDELEKPPVTRLTSAEGMRKFFQSVTPSTQPNDPDTPKNFLNLDLPSNRDYVNEYLTNRFLMAGEVSGIGHVSAMDTPSHRAYMNDQVPSDRTVAMERFINSPSFYDGPEAELQRLASSLGDLEEVGSGIPAPQNLSQDDGESQLSQRYIESLTAGSQVQEDQETDFGVDESGPADFDMDSKRKLSREQTPSASIRPSMSAATQDQFSNLSTYIPKKMIHPIASLVNPHAQLAAMEAKRAEEEYRASRQNTSMSVRISSRAASAVPHSTTPNVTTYRPMTAVPTRSESLSQWKSFGKDISYGQDILRDLSFVGRSGTAMDVRYTAHECGEMPEEGTKQIIAMFCDNSKSIPYAKVLSPRPVEVQELYTQNSLEEFYTLADGLYPPKLPKYRKPLILHKPKSAPCKKESSDSARSEKPKIQPLGKQLLNAAEAEMKEKENMAASEPVSNVKLDTVVKMVETVSEQMTYFKERLAPAPGPGFRQPTSNTVSRRPLSRPATATGHRSPSPVQRSCSPEIVSAGRPRPHTSFSRTNPFQGQDAHILDPELFDLHPHNSARSLPPNRMAGAIDWRGKISPDKTRSKWQRTKFGDHTYVKKMKGKRPVGATHAGKRPKTAPMTFREKWGTEQDGELNERVESQAATNTMMQVDQKAVDSMMVVQPIENWNTGMGSSNSIFLDEDFLKSLSGSRRTPGPSADTSTPVPMEYVPIVSSAPRSLASSRAQSRQTRSQADSQLEETPEFLDQSTCEVAPEAPVQSPVKENEQTSETVPQESHPAVQESHPTVHFEEEEKESDPEERQDVSDIPGVGTVTIDDQGRITGVVPEDDKESVTTDSILQDEIAPRQPIQYHTEDLHNGKVHIEVTAVPSAGRAPTPPEFREGPSQKLEKSDTWNFTPDVELQEIDSNRYLNQKKLEPWKSIVKPENYCFNCLPNSMSTTVGRSAGRMPGRSQSVSAQVLRMSRKQNEYFKKAPPVRTPPSIPSPYHQSNASPRYGETYNSGLEHHARKVKSPRHFMEQDLRKDIQSAPPGSMYSREDTLMGSLHVCRLSTRGSVDVMHEKRDQEESEFEQEGEGKVTRENTELTTEEKKSMISTATKSTAVSQQSIAHVGRPIAQVSHIPDPEEEAAAARMQFEAKAAVDIQRGYVARNVYKKLLREERERLEDERKAAIEIQRRYRGHLIRKSKIYNQTGLKKEHLEWAKDFKKIQDGNNARRQHKMEMRTETNTLNYHRSSSKISTIGPHVDIYQIYHPKRTGPTKRDMHIAATHIQKYIRGFLIRKRFERLKRKCIWHGSTYNKMVKDYKNMLKKCQYRHGIDRPKMPFTISDMNEYLDNRRRYESVFDKKAFGSELEVGELEVFFKECDLFPSPSEIEEAIDVVFNGQPLKRGLLKHEILELIFYIYVPKATGIPNTRRSTWLNPIIDGVEAKKLIGSDFVEKAPLEVCANLVIESRRERREKERLEKERQLTKDLAQMKADREEEAEKKTKTVQIFTPEEMKSATSK